jgi:hypothetical protein
MQGARQRGVFPYPGIKAQPDAAFGRNGKGVTIKELGQKTLVKRKTRKAVLQAFLKQWVQH